MPYVVYVQSNPNAESVLEHDTEIQIVHNEQDSMEKKVALDKSK